MKQESSNQVITDTPPNYYSCTEVRERIDGLLHLNAIINSNLGKDSTNEERAEAKEKIHSVVNCIRQIDKNFADSAFPEYTENG